MTTRDSRTVTRRTFLHGATAAAAAAALGPAAEGQAPEERAAGPPPRELKLAMASYSLRKFDFDQALAMTARLGLGAICLKSFHLPLDATPAQLAEAVEKARGAGITIYGGGVITMKTAEEVQQAFEYARAAGLTRIIASPLPAMLPLIDEQVRVHDLEVCIHNHGPGDEHWSTPEIAYPKIAQLDRRVGLCHDVGHTARVGADPVAVTRQYADRILDVHLKDVTSANKSGHAIACGRGIIDLPALLGVLLEVEYAGYLAFEYEQDPEDPLPGLAESVGYVRGVLDVI